jgi:YVTN family beta-propeller protein
MAPDGKRLYVATGRAGSVLAIDPATLDVAATIQVGKRPWGIALSPDARLLYTANGPSDDVSVVDLATQNELTRIKAGQSPWGVAVVPR